MSQVIFPLYWNCRRDWLTNDRSLKVLLTAALLIVAAFSMDANAQQGTRHFQCAGEITGVPSQALLEIAPGGVYTEGPAVAGQIRNQFSYYTFRGTLFGGTEGFISLVELRTGARIDRVRIGLGQAGFALRTEDGATYTFQCRE